MMKKRLVRKNPMLFGVCGGLGDYFDVDPTLIRLAFVISVIFLGFGFLLYLIMAIVMPSGRNNNY
jgi:phage shock protein C